MHFDDDQNWTLEGMETGKKDLYAVAVHEFGHALGIAHKSDKRSLMYPVYGYTDKLHEIDVRAVQAIYGIRSDQPQPGGRSRIPNLCKESSIDAITMTKAGKVFVFKGDWYWRLNDEADGIEKGYPRPIAKDWPGLPSNLNAALTFNNGKMCFFKGEKYWRYTNMQLDSGYPRMMRNGFPGIPDHVDGAFVCSDGKIFFFKDDQYWRFDHQEHLKVKPKYPEPISMWRGVLGKIDDVFLWKNGHNYFFKDEGYYKYNDQADEVSSDSRVRKLRTTTPLSSVSHQNLSPCRFRKRTRHFHGRHLCGGLAARGA